MSTHTVIYDDSQLAYACMSGDLASVIQYISLNGVDLELGATYISMAMADNYFAIIDFLIANGCRLQSEHMDMAIHRRSITQFQFLLERHCSCDDIEMKIVQIDWVEALKLLVPVQIWIDFQLIVWAQMWQAINCLDYLRWQSDGHYIRPVNCLVDTPYFEK
jgi:hypothetical protein